MPTPNIYTYSLIDIHIEHGQFYPVTIFLNFNCIFDQINADLKRLLSEKYKYPTLSHGNSYVFYEVANLYDLTRTI